MNPADVKTIIDTAAAQSDRWLFIALLVIGLIAIWMFSRYFIGELRLSESKHDELNKFVRNEHSELVRKCVTALDANTRVIVKVANQIRGEAPDAAFSITPTK